MVNIDPLIELVGFLHDKNPQVRAVAAQELVPYSTRGHPRISIFKSDSFRPITDLRILVLDEPKTAHDSLTILINLSQDVLIRGKLVDDLFISSLLAIILNKEHGLADLACMLLSNLAKSDAIKSLLTLRRNSTVPDCHSDLALDQLLDMYVRGAQKRYNQYANYDFLTNLFSDLTRFSETRKHFTTKQTYDGLVPLQKLIVFMDPNASQNSQVRRTGVASVVKNCCFETSAHTVLLDESAINVLLYLLSSLCGPHQQDGFRDDEVDAMFEALQYLPDSHAREPDTFTVTVLLDALLLLCATKLGRETLRTRQAYAVVRELHKEFSARQESPECSDREREEAEEVGECCDKLVNMLMRDEEPGMEDLDPVKIVEAHLASAGANDKIESSDEEDGIMDV